MKLKILSKLFLALLLSTSAALIAMAWLTQRSLERGFLDYVNQVETGHLTELIDRLQQEYRTQGSWQRLHYDDNIVGWLGIEPMSQVTASRDLDFLGRQSRAFFMFAGVLILMVALLAWLLARHLLQPIRSLATAAQQLAAGAYQTRISNRGHDEIAELARDFNLLARTLEDNRHAHQRWIADISHELRTPLAVMRSELEALADGIRPLQPQAIQSLHSEVLCLNKLVQDLHELSLSDLGALSYRKTRIDLRAILDQVTAAFAARLQHHRLHLRLSYNDAGLPPLWLHADGDRLLQLFSNLLENSVRYTDAGGNVMITVTRAAATVRIEVADSAPGVPAGAYAKLFERLYRVEVSRSRGGGGSGLGLAICKNIVSAHAGSICAQPSTLGGVSVIIELPLDII